MARNFEFKKRLGEGNFGEVWLTNETGLNRLCALKLIPPSKIPDATNFFHEAQILKEADHKNIVKVLETGFIKDAGRPGDDRIYIAMEYLKKGSLEDETKGGYVELTRAKRIMIDVLRGLEYTHKTGILHRDIKPGNILIGNTMEGKLSDFGLAIGGFYNLKHSSFNNYQYKIHLAPEVTTAQDITKTADIYSCGVTLYRLVNGDIYLPRLSDKKLEANIKSGKFPIRDNYREFVPRSLRTVINKAMNINPLKRYKSAIEMRRALEGIKIRLNWYEHVLVNGVRWRAEHNGCCYEIKRISKKADRWQIETQKGKGKKNKRKIGKYCHYDLTWKDAEKISKKILQEFTIGKVK